MPGPAVAQFDWGVKITWLSASGAWLGSMLTPHFETHQTQAARKHH